MASDPQGWVDEIHALFRTFRITLVSHVPDAGHQRLIELCQGDPSIRTVTLTTEEEAWRSRQAPISAGFAQPF